MHKGKKTSPSREGSSASSSKDLLKGTYKPPSHPALTTFFKEQEQSTPHTTSTSNPSSPSRIEPSSPTHLPSGLLGSNVSHSVPALSAVDSDANPLILAIEEGRADAVKSLLKKGADPTISDKSGWTPLHAAASQSNPKLCKTLLKHANVNVNAKDGSGWTPLHCAASAGNLRTCELLLKRHDVDVMQTNNEGTSLLHYLVRRQPTPQNVELYRSVLKQMAKKQIEVNHRNIHGEAPLHSACMKGNVDAVQFLLEIGADSNLSTNVGETGLHYAIRATNIEVVKLLCEYGADPTVSSQSGTPLDVAVTYNQLEILDILRKHESKTQTRGSLSARGNRSVDSVSRRHNPNLSAMRARPNTNSAPLLLQVTQLVERHKSGEDQLKRDRQVNTPTREYLSPRSPRSPTGSSANSSPRSNNSPRSSPRAIDIEDECAVEDGDECSESVLLHLQEELADTQSQLQELIETSETWEERMRREIDFEFQARRNIEEVLLHIIEHLQRSPQGQNLWSALKLEQKQLEVGLEYHRTHLTTSPSDSFLSAHAMSPAIHGIPPRSNSGPLGISPRGPPPVVPPRSFRAVS